MRTIASAAGFTNRIPYGFDAVFLKAGIVSPFGLYFSGFSGRFLSTTTQSELARSIEYRLGLKAVGLGVGVGVAVSEGDIDGLGVGVAESLGLAVAVGVDAGLSCAKLVTEGNKITLEVIIKPSVVFHADNFWLGTQQA